MSLITRCPACGTMFKVVADQLKLAQGWVRCGHCAEVFDASAQLLAGDVAGTGLPALMQRETPAPDSTGPMDAVGGVEKLPAPPDAPPEPSTEEVPSLVDRDHVPFGRLESDDAAQDDGDADSDPTGWKQALLKRQQQEIVAPLISASASDAQPAPAALATAVKSTSESGFQALGPTNTDAQDAGFGLVEAAQEVSFVRDARNKAFWSKPLVRGLLGGLLLFLSVLLALQWMVQQKDRLAAVEPRLLPVLQALCGPLHCEVRPPRQIESLVIDSSTFSRTGADTYRLSFMLKNTSGSILEVPSLELTLTDTQDQAVVRRVLAPRQFAANAATLAAHAELAGAVTIKVSGDAERAETPSLSSSASRAPPQVAGYRILAFYP